MVQFAPTRRIQIKKQARRVMVPTPPQIARQRPEPLLQRGDEAIERSRFAYYRSDLRGRLRQHSNFFFAEHAGFDGLHHQNSLQNAPFNQGNAEKRLVSILARIPKILEPGMVLHLFHRNRPHQFRDQPGQPLMHRHPQAADALPAKSNGRRQHQVRAIRFQQICRADVGVESLGNEGNHIHQRFGGLPALRRQVRNFIQRQHADLALVHGLLRVFSYVLVSVQSDSFASV